MKLYTCRRTPDGADELFVSAQPGTVYPVAAFGLQFRDMTDLVRSITPEQLAVVDLDRPSVCGDLPPKRFAIPVEDLKELMDVPLRTAEGEEKECENGVPEDQGPAGGQ